MGTIRTKPGWTFGLDTPISKDICSKDKNCLAIVFSRQGFKQCNYPNVIVPSRAAATFYKKQILSGNKKQEKS